MLHNFEHKILFHIRIKFCKALVVNKKQNENNDCKYTLRLDIKENGILSRVFTGSICEKVFKNRQIKICVMQPSKN